MSRASQDFQHPDEVLAFIEDIRERNQRTIDRYEEYVEQLSHGSVMAMIRKTIPDHILDTVEQRQNRKTGW